MRTSAPADPGGGTDGEELWSSLRQGARNIAGVRYQIAVTADLLVGARVGANYFDRFVPEGFEDIDLVGVDGRRWFVQAKEMGAGSRRLTAANLADIIGHAAEAAGDAYIAIVSDAAMGSGMRYTGWDKSLAELHDHGLLHSVETHLVARGHGRELLHRTHTVHIPWTLAAKTIRSLWEGLHLNPAVAGLVYARLLADLTTIAADQRLASSATPLFRRPGDIDAIVRSVLETVDIHALDAAVAEGVCEPIDFITRSELTRSQFLQGVDAVPAHVASGLDVFRWRELADIYKGLEADRHVLLVGPSGAGKSALLWRAAREASRASRAVRVRRVASSADVQMLVRWVRLQEPSADSPMLVCVDDLGRNSTAACPAAADQLLEMPNVRILGAARAEDFRPGLLRGRATIVTPELDEPLARQIADDLARAGLDLRRDVAEAFPVARGLLMEFVALISSGRRMDTVLAEQVDALRRPERRTQRQVLRLVCAAHGLGAPLSSSTLAEITGNPLLGDELSVLHGEHLILLDPDGNWGGLHELRSATITHLLHQSPPPTRSETYAQVLPALPPAARGDAIARAAEQFEGDLGRLADAVAALIPSTSDAKALSVLLVGLSKADAFGHLRMALPILRAHETATLDIESLATVVYTTRFAGVELPGEMGQRLRDIADQLPDYPPSLRERGLRGLTESHLENLIAAASLPDAIDLLEAVENSFKISAGSASSIWQSLRIRAPCLASIVRVPACLSSLAELRGPDEVEAAFGPAIDRARSLVGGKVDGLRVDLDLCDEGFVVSADLLASTAINPEDQAVSLCRELLGVIPEATIAEVKTIGLDGAPHMYAGLQLGYKRIPRTYLPRGPEVRRTVHFFEALRRSRGAESWTRRLRDQAVVARAALQALEGLPDRVLPRSDNARRLREWRLSVAQTAVGSTHLPGLPNPQLTVTTRAVTDEVRSESKEDPAKSALDALGRALTSLSEQLTDGHLARPAVVAGQLRDVLPMIREARRLGSPTLSSVGETLPSALEDLIDLNASLLLVSQPKLAGVAKQSGERWLDVARRVVEEECTRQLDGERVSIESWLAAAGVDPQIVLIPGESYAPGSIALDGWLVLLPHDQLSMLHSEDAIPEPQRNQLAFRLVVALVVSDQLLPIAYRLGTSQWFPIADPIDIDRLAQGAGRDVVRGSPLDVVQRCIARLMGVSYEVARRSMRDSVLGESTETTPIDTDSEMAAVQSDVRTLSQEDLRASLGALVDLVTDELSSGMARLAPSLSLMLRSGQTNPIMTALDGLVMEGGRLAALSDSP